MIARGKAPATPPPERRRLDADLRPWLLDCPALRSISSLALDAAACNLIDLGSELAAAVSVDVRLRALELIGLPGRRPPRRADRFPWREAGPHLRIASGSAALSGTIGKGIAVSRSRRFATLHLARRMPETVSVALAGRRLAELSSWGVLDRGGYVVSAAETTALGADVTFRVPLLPVAAASELIRRLSRGRGER